MYNLKDYFFKCEEFFKVISKGWVYGNVKNDPWGRIFSSSPILLLRFPSTPGLPFYKNVQPKICWEKEGRVDFFWTFFLYSFVGYNVKKVMDPRG